MSSDIENQQQNNKQDKLTSDISFELEQAKKKLQLGFEAQIPAINQHELSLL